MQSLELFRRSSALALGAALMIHAPAIAQDAQDAAITLQDVVVTAEKRSTSIQKTPISIQAVEGAALKTAGPADLSTIAKTIPSVLFGHANGNSQLTIRGIGNDQVSPGFEGRTAMHIDGVFLASLNGVLGSFYDLERVEITEGPQGDLFGRNATAGAVDIITKKPSVGAGFNGYAQVTAGNYNLFQAQGAVGAPITSNLAFRIAGDVVSRGGYGKNLANGKDINDQKSRAVRAAISWRPSDDFRLDLSGDYFRENDRNYATTYGGAYNEDLTPAQLVALVTPAVFTLNGVRTLQYGTVSTGTFIGFAPSPRNKNDLSEDQDPRYRVTMYGVRLGMEYDINPDLTLRSITGYRHNFHDQFLGTDFSAAKILTNDVYEKVNWHSQEFQLVGQAGIQKFVAGVYYFRSVANTLVQTAAGYPLVAAGVPGQYYQQLSYGAKLTTESEAVYVHDEIAFTDRFSLTVGARYTEDKIDEATIGYTPLAQVGLVPFNGFRYAIPASARRPARSVTYKNFSPRVTASFKPDTDTLLYATYSRGFKSGGYNPGADRPPIAPRDLPPFKPEKITDYEAGLKRDWADHRLRTNLSAFYYDYKNLQVQQKTPDAVVLINNAASAELYGLEASVQAIVSDRLSLNAGLSLLHAEYKEFCNTDTIRPLTPSGAACTAQGFPAGTQDLSGNRLNRAPSRVFTAGADYRIPLANGSLLAHADATFTSKMYFNPFNVEPLSSPSQELFNASLRYDHDSGAWGSLWIKNISDKQVANQISNSALNTGANLATRLNPPRTFGATIGYIF